MIEPRCPDPRGPLVDREDFLEGQIDALAMLQRAYRDDIDGILGAAEFLTVREGLDSTFTGNTPLEQFAADLEVAALEIGATIDAALQQARWKLAKVRQNGGQS